MVSQKTCDFQSAFVLLADLQAECFHPAQEELCSGGVQGGAFDLTEMVDSFGEVL
jgi:hypothetical protein